MRIGYSFKFTSARSDVGPNKSSHDSPMNQRLAKSINAASSACMQSSRPYSMSVYLPPSSDDFQLKRLRASCRLSALGVYRGSKRSRPVRALASFLLLAREDGASTFYRRTSLSRKDVEIVLTVSLGHRGTPVNIYIEGSRCGISRFPMTIPHRPRRFRSPKHAITSWTRSADATSCTACKSAPCS